MPSAHDLEQHRTALTGHCYRMMGSAADADDAVQETMVRAWHGLGSFEERASLRTWLTRIATRVCLDALADRTRRLRPLELEGPGTVDDPLTELPRASWIEPIPDALALPADADPVECVSPHLGLRRVTSGSGSGGGATGGLGSDRGDDVNSGVCRDYAPPSLTGDLRNT